MTRIVRFADDGYPDPKQLQRLQKSIRGKEQAPSARHFTRSYEYFQQQLETLGSPYDVTRIPISVLKQMQRDPMISFGLHFIYSPVNRARWYIQCEDPKICAFIDNALRRILARYIQQRSQAFAYGFAPMIKRFQLEKPNWTYLDPAKGSDPQPVWDEGNIDALTWKPFSILPSDPTQVQPSFKESDGSFNGIDYQGGANLIPFNQIINDEDGKKHIDVAHALWVTNEKDSANGSLWGYPRTGYVYRIWYSKWFRWALFDRFVERKADPPYKVYYPPTESFKDDDTGEIDPAQSSAIRIGDAARSGGTLALPGNAITGYDDRPISMREWDIEELEVRGDFSNFLENFQYLDVLLLRGLWIPEQALIEGVGGTSSRNVAESEIGFHKEASGALADEIDEELNRFVIPDLVSANFPEYKGEVKKVTTGFTEADQQSMQQALQWLIQAGDETAARQTDVRELLQRLGMPLKTLQQVHQEDKEAEEALRESTPPVINPDDEGNAGVNEEGYYVKGREQLALSELEDFIHNLPPSKHFSDKQVLSFAKALRARWRREYKNIYDSFADYLSKQNFDEAYIETLNLDAALVPNKRTKKEPSNWVEARGGLPKAIADMAGDLISERGFTTSHAIATAVNQARKLCGKGNQKYCRAIASWERKKNLSLAENDELIIKEFIQAWQYDRQKLSELIDDSESILKKVMDRAGTKEARDAGLSADIDIVNDVADYLSERGAEFVKIVDDSIKEELRIFLSNQVRDGKNQAEIISAIQEHFIDYPDWKADRLVRSEIRNAYNMATLFAGESKGVKVVRAKDAQKGETDETCLDRDGRFFKISDAILETPKEHPNGTLEWNLTDLESVPEVVKASEMPDGSESLGYYDHKNNIIYLSETIPESIEKEYLQIIGDILERERR